MNNQNIGPKIQQRPKMLIFLQLQKENILSFEQIFWFLAHCAALCMASSRVNFQTSQGSLQVPLS